MIFHSTFVQNRLIKFHREYPQLNFGLSEEDDTFILVLPADFNKIPSLDRVVVWHAVNDMMTEFKEAGIKVELRADPRLML